MNKQALDKTKLNKWAELLLDTGKRNNLISFHDVKATSAEIVFPNIKDVFDKVDGTSILEVYDPRIADDEYLTSNINSEDEAIEKVDDSKLSKKEYIELHSAKIKRQNQILVYSKSINPIRAIKNIDKKAKSQIEETGVNVAYIAFGFINWTENKSSTVNYRAPILLAPILLERESEISPYYIKTTGEDFIVNPTFNYKLFAEYGVKLPEYEDQTYENICQRFREC